MPRKTTATITDLQQYLDELACVRERGWAFDGSENEPDGCCVAVPLRSSRLPLAVSVSAPPSRLSMTRAEKIAAVLIDVTRQMIEELAEQPLQP